MFLSRLFPAVVACFHRQPKTAFAPNIASTNFQMYLFLLLFVTFLLDEKSNQKNQEAPDSLPLRQEGLHFILHLATAVCFIATVVITDLNRYCLLLLSAFVPCGTALPAPAGTAKEVVRF